MSAYRTRDPVTGAYETDSFYQIEETISSKLKYVGRTYHHNALITDAVWQIRRDITTGNTKTTSYANRAQFDQQWSARVSLFNAANLDNQFSVKFDGVNDRIQFGDNYDFDRQTAFSISFWFWAQNIAADRYIISKVSNDAATNGWRVGQQATTGKIMLQVRPAGQGYAPVYTNTNLSAQTWYHIAVTYSGSSNQNGFKIYINSVLDSSFGSAVYGYSWANNNVLELGCSKLANFFSGNVDELSIWSKELTAAEVSEIYNAGSPISLADHSAYSNLLSWWRMGDGDTDPTVLDSVGLINGTMEYSPTFVTEVA